MIAKFLALVFVGFLLGCLVLIVTLPLVLLAKLVGWKPAKAKGRRVDVKAEVVRAQWEYDRLWNRKEK